MHVLIEWTSNYLFRPYLLYFGQYPVKTGGLLLNRSSHCAPTCTLRQPRHACNPRIPRARIASLFKNLASKLHQRRLHVGQLKVRHCGGRMTSKMAVRSGFYTLPGPSLIERNVVLILGWRHEADLTTMRDIRLAFQLDTEPGRSANGPDATYCIVHIEGSCTGY